MLDPTIHALLTAQGYTVGRPLTKTRGNVVVLAERDGWQFVFKRFSKPSPRAWRTNRILLPEIAGQYGNLIIPECVDSGKASDIGYWVILSYHEGQRFPHTVGGAGFPPDTVGMMLDAVDGLSNVAVESLSEGLRTELASRSPYADCRIQRNLKFAARHEALVDSRITDVQRILQPCIERRHARNPIISNGDFHLRNCIRLTEGTVALVDWDAARLSGLELEWCLAYQWFMMGDNAEWQSMFLNGAKSRFEVDPESFRSVLMAVALHQFYGWRRKEYTHLVPRAADLIKYLLNHTHFPFG